MFVFLKALCARFFTSAAQIVERAQTVFSHLNTVSRSLRDVSWLSFAVHQFSSFTKESFLGFLRGEGGGGVAPTPLKIQ